MAYALAMDSVVTRARLYDCYFEPAVRVDAVHPATHGFAAYEPCPNTDHVLAVDRGSNVPFSMSGIPC